MDTNQKILNLLPKENRRNVGYEKMSRFITTVYISIALIIIIGGILLLPSYFYLTFQEDIFAQRVEQAKKSVEAQRIQEIETMVSATNEKLSIVSRKTATMPLRVTEYMDTISRQAPNSISLTKFIYDKEKFSVTLNGTAGTRDDFLAFLDGLRRQNMFKSIDSPITNILKETDLSFMLTIELTPPSNI